MGGYPFSMEDLATPSADYNYGPGIELPGTPQRPEDVYQQYQQNQAQYTQQLNDSKAKSADLDLGHRLLTLLDPNVPKPARQFLYNELSRTMGVDPKGNTSKELGTMILGLDPEASEGIRRNLAKQITDAPPGQVQQLVKQVLTGNVSGMQLIGFGKGGTAGVGGMGEGEMSGTVSKGPSLPARSTAVAADEATGTTRPLVDQIAQSQEPIPGQESAAITQRRISGPGETPVTYQQTNPQLVKALGLNPKVKYRNDDLIREGYTIPQDPKEQRELVTKLNDQAATTLSTAVEAARMYQLFKGRPEVLGLVGGTARTADQIIDQARGLVKLVGKAFDKDVADEVNVKDPTTKSYAVKAAKAVWDAYNKSGAQQTAVDAARLQGAMINMAYSMAAARGIPGNRLTNAVINQHLAELGNSASVPQFEATLKDTLQRATERVQNEMAIKIGKTGGIDVSVLDENQLKTLAANSEILPDNLKKQVSDHIGTILSGTDTKTYPNLNRASPTIEDEERKQAQDTELRDVRARNTEYRAQVETTLKALREERQNRQEGFARDQANLHQLQEQRRYELALRREDRVEQHQRRQEITAAFLALGRAIASGAHVSAGGGGGGSPGGEDASAFRITPRSAGGRGPPQPIDASRFQRGAR